MAKGINEVEERRLRGKIVGTFLKTMRQRAGLTQHDLASKLSYTTAQFISNWERGISLPPLDVLPKLSYLCKIPPRILVETLYSYQEEVLKLQKKQLLALFARSGARSGQRA